MKTGPFLYHCNIRPPMRCLTTVPTGCDEKGFQMAWKPWYKEVAEMNNQHEREEFIRGVFGFRPKEKQPIAAMLIAGYVGGKVASKGKK